jgi:hypothetical protein
MAAAEPAMRMNAARRRAAATERGFLLAEIAELRAQLEETPKAKASSLQASLQDGLKRLAAISSHMVDIRTEARKLEHDYVKGVPVVQQYNLDRAMDAVPNGLRPIKDGVCVTGTEYLGSVQISGNQAKGGVIWTQVVSPPAMGGARLANFAQMYDLWRIKKLVFEFISTEPSTTGGAIVSSMVADVNEDPALTLIGDGLIRDCFERPGSRATQIFGNLAFGINLPQQQVFYTSNMDVPNLSVAGILSLVQITQIAAGSLGLVNCHYEIEFWSESAVRISAATISSSINGTVTWGNGPFSSGTTFSIQRSAWDPFQGLTNSGNGWVGSAIVSSSNSTIYAGFFSLNAGSSEEAVTFGSGRRVWFRYDKQRLLVLFYASYGAAAFGKNNEVDTAAATGGLMITVNNTLSGTNPSAVLEQLTYEQLPETVN